MATQSIRTAIGDRLATIFGNINTSVMLPDAVTPKYSTDVLHSQRRLVFLDEVEDNGFPAIYVTAASESRSYSPNMMATKRILFIVRGYILDDVDSDAAMNNLIDDVETALNEDYFTTQLNGLVHNITIAEITSDEGLLSPEAVFEMVLEAVVVEST